MFSIDELLASVQACISENSETAFRNFILSNPGTHWVIAGDFVMSGNERHNDVMAFSVMPLDREPMIIARNIYNAIKKDIKHIKYVNDSMLDLLKSKSMFHFCFLPSRGRHDFFSLGEVRVAIEATIDVVGNYRTSSEAKNKSLANLMAIRQKAKSNSFNYNLLSDVSIMSAFCANIAFLIDKHANPQHIQWFIDRDALVEAFDGWAWHAIQANLASLWEKSSLRSANFTQGVAIDLEAKAGEKIWFDDFVRVPDFMAGTMARWDMTATSFKEAFTGDRPKFEQVARNVIAENPHVVIMRVDFGQYDICTSSVRCFNLPLKNLGAYEADSILGVPRHIILGKPQGRNLSLRRRLMLSTYLYFSGSLLSSPPTIPAQSLQPPTAAQHSLPSGTHGSW